MCDCLFIDVTVGICAYNEDINLSRLLDSVLNHQNLSKDSEVLLVCSGCTDRTVEIAQDYAARDQRVNVFVENERLGKASAVNKILQNAKGIHIIFISADTLPSPGCFARLISKMKAPDVGIVCGKPVPTKNSSYLLSRLVNVLWLSHDHVFKEMNDAGLARHASEMFCLRNGIVDKIPPETVNDDAYIAVMTRNKGWLVKYNSEARVTISGPQNFRDYMRQRRRIIFGHYQIMRLTGDSPQYLVCLAPLYPLKALKSAVWLCGKCGITSLLPFALIEFSLNIVAATDFVRHKSFSRWPVAASTKTVNEEGASDPDDSSVTAKFTNSRTDDS